MTLPTVAVGALGGTIAMTPAHPGEPVAPELSAAQLVRAVRGLDAVAHVTATSLRNLPSPALTTADVLDALAWARAQVDGGAAGVVLTHGTDTLEETAFLLDLLWDRPAPLVLTGAMRPPRSPGPDGPANLYAAVVVAAAPAGRDLGAVVVLDDEVHLARWVTKTRTGGVGAFASPGAGPVGRVAEGTLVLTLRPARRVAPLPVPAGAAQVALLEFTLGRRRRAAAAGRRRGVRRRRPRRRRGRPRLPGGRRGGLVRRRADAGARRLAHRQRADRDPHLRLPRVRDRPRAPRRAAGRLAHRAQGEAAAVGVACGRRGRRDGAAGGRPARGPAEGLTAQDLAGD